MVENDRVADGEEQQEDHIFQNYPCAVYYVQSPSTMSHANSTDCRNNIDSACLSPFIITNQTNTTTNHQLDHHVSPFMLTRYSSSRASNNSNSFLHHHKKNISYDDFQSHGTTNIDDQNRLICGKNHHEDDDGDGDDDDDDDDDDEDEEHRRKGCWRFFSFSTSSSYAWISLQISWRLMVSFAAALLVFFLATKPPSPNFSLQMRGIPQFLLGEGVDESGVTTKFLTCNCSLDLNVDNKSKLFGLHIHSSTIQLSFGPLVFATSQGPKLYAESYHSTDFQLYVGTSNKAMYGAGRSMQDMLESGKGLPLKIRLGLRSNFRVLLNLIKPRFHHHAECMLVVHRKYDKRHHTQAYNSSCRIISTS